MNKIQKIAVIASLGLVFSFAAAPIFMTASVNAGEQTQLENSGGGSLAPGSSQEGPNTSILDSSWEIEDMLGLVLALMTTGVGIAATVSFVVAGVTYSSAGGSADQVKKAKDMIMNTVIGLVAYSLLWAFLQWLIPGGILND